MAISAADVMKLRQITGAGPVDCKKALEAAGGDFAAAEKALKEKGLAAVEKRADRATNEGRIFVHAKNNDKAGNIVSMVEVVSETDFVAKNPDFIKMGGEIAIIALDENIDAPNDKLSGMVTELATRIREKMELKRIKLIKAAADEYVSAYVHGDGQNLGVAVRVKSDKPEAFADAEVREFVHSLALHVAAFNPKAIDKASLDQAFVKEQEEIYKGQMKNDPKMAGKPEAAIGKILEGKMAKFLSDICFVDQKYVKDDKLTVAQALAECGKKAGAALSVVDYVYMKVGA